MQKEIVMSGIYGTIFTPEEIKERDTWHETTWVEVEIPQDLEEKIITYIIKKVKKYEKKCGCGLCKLNEK